MTGTLFEKDAANARRWYADLAAGHLVLRESVVDGEVRAAVFSPSEDYRYLLVRRWAPGPICMFAMLNPSLATEIQDDRTVARCRRFAQREGYGTLVVVNLYALRSPYPKDLKKVSDPVGPDNDDMIGRAAAVADLVVAAWGTNVLDLARVALAVDRLGKPVYCLGTTKFGYPKHPLYLPADAPLVRFV